MVGNDFVAGDAIMNSVPAKHLLPLLIYSAKDFKDSYNKLIEINADKYYVGHGGPVTVEDLKANLKFAMEVEEF